MQRCKSEDLLGFNININDLIKIFGNSELTDEDLINFSNQLVLPMRLYNDLTELERIKNNDDMRFRNYMIEIIFNTTGRIIDHKEFIKKLLFFWSSYAKPIIDVELPYVVNSIKSDSIAKLLPAAHTCHHILDIDSRIESADELYDKLLIAINSTGKTDFGFRGGSQINTDIKVIKQIINGVAFKRGS